MEKESLAIGSGPFFQPGVQLYCIWEQFFARMEEVTFLFTNLKKCPTLIQMPKYSSFFILKYVECTKIGLLPLMRKTVHVYN